MLKQISTWGKSYTMCIFTLGFITFAFNAFGTPNDQFIDYSRLDHRILIEKLRSGNHDASGENHYVFQIKAYALAIIPSERKKKFEDRLKIEEELGNFGEKILPALSIWTPQDDKRPFFSFQGDKVRRLTAKAMRQFKVKEEQIALLIEIAMVEKNKKFFFLADDEIILKESYYLIPETLPHKADTKNKSFNLKDEKGTFVSIQVMFDNV